MSHGLDKELSPHTLSVARPSEQLAGSADATMTRPKRLDADHATEGAAPANDRHGPPGLHHVRKLGARSLSHIVERVAVSKRNVKPGMALLGPADHTAPLAQALSRGGLSTWKVVASLRDDRAGDIEHLRALAYKGAIDSVVIAIPSGNASRVRALCEQLMDLPVRFYLGIDPELIGESTKSILRASPFPFPELLPAPHGLWRRASKRLFDLIFVAITLPIVAPVLAAAAIAIRVESCGPVFFTQWRFGRGNKPVLVWKFRTMYADKGDPTGEQRTLARDPRVTKVGRLLRRTSIDELPQLFNVLKGEMSLVGPRPHAIQMRVGGAYYHDAVAGYSFRHRVKPGITGWAQINGSRGEVDTLEKARQRVELDLWYINRWSLSLDFWIILRTVFGGFASPKAD